MPRHLNLQRANKAAVRRFNLQKAREAPSVWRRKHTGELCALLSECAIAYENDYDYAVFTILDTGETLAVCCSSFQEDFVRLSEEELKELENG